MSFTSRFFTALNKRTKALEEDVDLSNYLQPEAFSVKPKTEPFSYIVIDNFLKPEFEQQLKKYYDQIFKKGLSSDVKDATRFHPFDERINYDGYVFSPELKLDEPLKLFFSVQWNLFFSKLFNKPTTLGTNFAFHHHPARDKTGWVHNDYATYFFPHKLILPNGVTATRGEASEYKLTDGENLAKTHYQKRSIALIYYFNNPEWKEGDGGETGLYKTKDEKSLVIKVAPVNNRLLAFDVCPESFHAFQENLKDRNTFVQWFHSELEWCEGKYGFL